MSAIKIKVDDISMDNTFEMTKLILRVITITKNHYLSETELQALTYFVVNGYSKLTKDSLVENKLFKSMQAVYNTLTQLRKFGIIVKTNYGEKINDEYNIKLKDIDLVCLELLIKK